jgi:hypothetical protein
LKPCKTFAHLGQVDLSLGLELVHGLVEPFDLLALGFGFCAGGSEGFG